MRAIATREDIRDVILDAADRLLARYGYKKMTVEDLAQEVGIGKGTIYLHFPSKEEVVLSHVDRIVERLKVRLLAIAREESPPAERLRLMLVERVLFRFDSVQHYTESLSDLLAALRRCGPAGGAAARPARAARAPFRRGVARHRRSPARGAACGAVPLPRRARHGAHAPARHQLAARPTASARASWANARTLRGKPRASSNCSSRSARHARTRPRRPEGRRSK